MKIQLKVNVATIIFIFFSIIFIVTHIVNMPSMIANMLVAVSGLIALAYSILKKGIKSENIYLILAGIFYSFLMIISILYNGNANLDNVLWIWAYMGIACLIYEFDISPKCFVAVAFSVDILFFIYALIGEQASGILTIGSQNNISTYAIFFMVFAYLSMYVRGKQINYFLAIFTVTLSTWTSSRAGILAAAFFLMSLFLYNFLFVKGEKVRSLIKWIILIVAALYAVNHFFGQFLIDLTIKMNRYGTSSIRTVIWEEYLSGTFNNMGNFIFGVNTKDTQYQWLSFYNGNTHNAFLMLHAKFGVLGFVSVVIILVRTVVKSLRLKEYMMIIALLTIVIRSLFDWTGFPGLYDVTIWYFFLFCINRKRELSNSIAGAAQ